MANGKMSSITALIALAAVAMALSAPGAALGQSAASPDPADAGKAVFKRANCFGCHKWHGNGGGGYGGDALSLRKTELTREQITETVACGRPGTGMPFFTRGAYDTVNCYGMNRQEVGGQIPPEANTFLRATDIDVVASYVMAELPEERAATLARELWSVTADTLVLVEPGTPAGFARIRVARAALLGEGAHVAASMVRSG